eukprot:g5133.t1
MTDAVWDWLVGPLYEDPRTSDWPILDIRLVTAVTISYLILVPLGIYLMHQRPPFKLKLFTTVHNSLLFLLSVYMCVETLHQSYREFHWETGRNIICPKLDPRGGPFSLEAYKLAVVLWIHYVSKAYEFVDTFIMILKKNTRQITFLHVYHHATTFFPIWWSVIVYGPGGAAYFCCAMNSFVHIWMYAYYLLSGLGVKLRAFKPIITYGQMIQFVMYISQGLYMLITDCYRPRLTVVFLITHSFVLLLLFSNFAHKTYGKAKLK